MEKKRNDFYIISFPVHSCGGDGTRIRVHTIRQIAFYMLSSVSSYELRNGRNSPYPSRSPALESYPRDLREPAGKWLMPRDARICRTDTASKVRRGQWSSCCLGGNGLSLSTQ